MEFRLLKTFIQVAQSGNFTHAATELGYAQSTVTIQIQLLEDQLGTRLFERLGKNISLTPHGERLLHYSREILRLCAEAREVVSGGEEPRGLLSIGAVESLCIQRLPDLVKEYRRRYPAVEVVLRIGNCTGFPRWLVENTVDVAFFLDQPLSYPELVTVQSYQEPMLFLAQPGHVLVNQDIYPGNLTDQPLILTENGCPYRGILESILEKAGVKPHSVLETGSLQAIKQFAMSGLGLTLLPQTAVAEEVAQNRLIPLKWHGPEIYMHTQVIHHKDKWISPALRAFLDLTGERLPDDGKEIKAG